jgi:hypothetical protein
VGEEKSLSEDAGARDGQSGKEIRWLRRKADEA